MSGEAAASNCLPSHEQLALIKGSSSLALHKRAAANWPLNAKINLSMGSRPPDDLLSPMMDNVFGPSCTSLHSGGAVQHICASLITAAHHHHFYAEG